MLSPRLSEVAVIRRQIVEGGFAVLKLTRLTQATQKYQLHVFDRSAGDNAVTFAEYDNQDLNICVELVAREKTKAEARRAAPPPQPLYNNPYGLPPVQPQQQAHTQQHQPRAFIPPPPPPLLAHTGSNPNLSSAISNLDSAALQQLLGAMQLPPNMHHQQHQSPQTPSTPSTTDLSRLLAAAAKVQPLPQQSQSQPQSAQNHAQAYANLASNPAFAGLFGNAMAGASGQAKVPISAPVLQSPGGNAGPAGPQDMASIMAQLARYGR